MRLVIAVVDKEREAAAIEVLDRAGVAGFSVIPSVFGRGGTGTHRGNRVFPGENAMIVALVTPAQLAGVSQGFTELTRELRADEGLKVITLEADSVL